METWMEGIRKVQARRKEEMVGMANRNHSSAARVQDNKGKLRTNHSNSAFETHAPGYTFKSGNWQI